MTRPSKAKPPADTAERDRRAMLAKLHLAKKQLALTDDSYRDVLRRVTKKESAAELGPSQLDAVLAEFRRLGWKPKPKFRRTEKPQVRMIHAVWKDIAALLGRGREEELRAFVRRQTRTKLHPDGVSAPEFLDAAMGNRVLEGLKAWRARLREAAKAKGEATNAGAEA